jgi:hypothetical protein
MKLAEIDAGNIGKSVGTWASGIGNDMGNGTSLGFSLIR